MQHCIITSPREIRAIQLTISRGKGKEGNIFRHVTQIYDMEGKFLGEWDPVICKLCREHGSIVSNCTSDHK